MIAKSEVRTTPVLQNGYAVLQSGDRMDQPTFHDLYTQTPDDFKAELIGGIVFVASPVSRHHGKPHSRVGFWLELYEGDTPGIESLVDTTTILGRDNEPQPDQALRIEAEYGGQSDEDEHGFIVGPCEFVVEVANSSYAIDTHAKRTTYFQAGAIEYLIVFAKSKSVIWYTRGSSEFVEIKPDSENLLKSRVFPGLWLDSTGLFEKSSKTAPGHPRTRSGHAGTRRVREEARSQAGRPGQEDQAEILNPQGRHDPVLPAVPS